MTNLAEMLRRTVERFPQRTALTYGGKHLSWYDLYARAALVRDNLRAAGIRRGDVVAIYAERAPAQVVGIFGIAMADAVFTILSPLLKANQVKHQVSDANVKAVVGTQVYLASFKQLWGQRYIHVEPMTPEGLPCGGETGAIHDVDVSKPLATSIPADVSNIIYTSGSTGRAKGVVIPHRTLLDGARIVSQYLKITGDDVLLSLLPFNFDYGLNQLLTTVFTGARMVLHDFTFPQDLVDTMIRERVTGMAAVPSLWPHLFNPRLLDQAAKPEFEHLRYLTTAGGMHSQELLVKLTAFFPHTEIIVMYGLTESFRSTYLPFSELFKRPGSIGKPVPEVEILVLDEAGKRCGAGEKGELIHRGAFVSYGYLNDPELTQSKFIKLNTGGPGCLPEMAVRSGDIVSLDQDGFIYFHGRCDMQIKCNGYRVSPTEVEEAVLLFSGISHAAVFGLSDPNLGESVNLAYATYQGLAVDHSQLARHLSDLLPHYAIPRRIQFYESLPLTVTGKIDYPALKRSADEKNACDAAK